MNCFQLVKTVLDELYEKIPLGTDSAKDEAIKSSLSYLSKKYENSEEGIEADYGDPITRFAYIYRYATAHANIVYQLIRDIPQINEVFLAEKVNVTSLGGGPGSDFLGVLKFMNNYSYSIKTKKLRSTICDREESWSESWYDVDDKVDTSFLFNVSTFFQKLDVTTSEALKLNSKICAADLFTIFYNWFDDLASSCGIERIVRKDYYEFQTEFDEERGDLGGYNEKFGFPKLQAKIAYRIYRKG